MAYDLSIKHTNIAAMEELIALLGGMNTRESIADHISAMQIVDAMRKVVNAIEENEMR